VTLSKAGSEKPSTGWRQAGDNNVFTDDLRLEEKYQHVVKKQDTTRLRKPIARSDVELWEQEKADSER
jgi:hypothetical protein